MVERDADLLFAAAPMHDLGKIGMPDSVLRKEGPLFREEWEIMKRHPEIGSRLLEGSRSPLIQLAREIALSHHERWDGSGYPHGLRGEQIPFASRIVAIGDCYDALRSRRPYKDAFSHDEACDVILKGDGRTFPQHFETLLLEIFAQVQERFREVWDSIQDREEIA